VDSEIRKALNVWSEYTDLKFTQRRSGRVHIDVRFDDGEHGDGDPFDGQGGTLAHAFFPVFGGDAHFDDDESWTMNTHRGTNLLQTAAHEFGHSLGLSHSESRSALMAPFYRGFQSKVSLNKDDINGIQELYGEKTVKPNPEDDNRIEDDDDEDSRSDNDGDISRRRGDEELCEDASFDAIVTLGNNDTYTFKVYLTPYLHGTFNALIIGQSVLAIDVRRNRSRISSKNLRRLGRNAGKCGRGFHVDQWKDVLLQKRQVGRMTSIASPAPFSFADIGDLAIAQWTKAIPKG